jgi:hypothetical protein
MEQLLVATTNDGHILIEQSGYGEDGAGILIDPDQLPLLIKWLQEADEEIRHRVLEIEDASLDSRPK